MAYLRLFVCGCLLSVPCLAAAQSSSSTCRALLPKMRASHIPHLALATFAEGSQRDFYCSTESQGLNAEAVFEAASLSKPVFAAAVLALVQQGKLDLDRPLMTYLPGPYRHVQNPFAPGVSDVVTDPRFGRITARMVLSHTSGLPNWSRHQPLALSSEPGTTWSYSGEGYVFLQQVVETIAGQDLQSVVRDTVFVPLGMVHSSFVWQPGFAAQLLPPYTGAGVAATPELYQHALASSTLYTTLGDYAKFVTALLHPASGSPFALEETQQVEVNRKLKLAWGLGLAIEVAPRRAFFHWGANPGYQSFFLVQPGSGRGVLFLTDSDHGLDLVDRLVADFVPGRHPALSFPMLHPKD